jgi:PAS domain S-box-containing protein
LNPAAVRNTLFFEVTDEPLGDYSRRTARERNNMSSPGADERSEPRESALNESIAYVQSIIDTVREPLVVLDAHLRVTTASRAFYQTFGVAPEETLRQFVYNLGDGQWNIPALRTLLEEVLPTHRAFDDFEVAHNFPAIGEKVMLLNGRKLWRQGNNTEHILLAIEDVTERKRASRSLFARTKISSALLTLQLMIFVHP